MIFAKIVFKSLETHRHERNRRTFLEDGRVCANRRVRSRQSEVVLLLELKGKRKADDKSDEVWGLMCHAKESRMYTKGS